MTTTTRHDIPGEIEHAVRAVPGVAALYRTGSLASRIVDAGARLLGVRGDDEPLVRVEETGDSVRVDAAIGVRASGGAGEVVRDVHDVVRAILEGWGLADPAIRLTVVHVEAEPQGAE